jgi:hypothetical protein
MSMTVGVSLAQTPVAEVSERAAAIEALGWREVDRADPWAVIYQKDVPEDAPDPYGEVRAAMGDHWMTTDQIAEFINRPR